LTGWNTLRYREEGFAAQLLKTFELEDKDKRGGRGILETVRKEALH